jgi:hypothetical protein
MSQVSNSDFNKKKSHLIRDAKQSKKKLTTSAGNRAEANAKKKPKGAK